jgi:hypothetical protein
MKALTAATLALLSDAVLDALTPDFPSIASDGDSAPRATMPVNVDPSNGRDLADALDWLDAQNPSRECDRAVSEIMDLHFRTMPLDGDDEIVILMVAE